MEQINNAVQQANAYMQAIAERLSPFSETNDMAELQAIGLRFNKKVEDFYAENRNLNIGVIGQVKAGKSSFLNTLLFGGKEILPKAHTPKTATLTKMEYAEKNSIVVDYYTEDEWEVIKENAAVDLNDDIYTSAKGLVETAAANGIDVPRALKKRGEEIPCASYEELKAKINDYVSEDGKYMPVVKAVTLYINDPQFKDLTIVDTPGLNDPVVSRTMKTREFIEYCDVVFFLSRASYFMQESDWVLLSTQLPQKGVKRIVALASMFDGGLSDLLRKPDPDDPFADCDEDKTDSVPKACDMIKESITKSARQLIDRYIEDLKARGVSEEIQRVISQCRNPIMISSLAQNMIDKTPSEFNGDEENLLSKISSFIAEEDLVDTLTMIGNFHSGVQPVFEEIKADKEETLSEKARSFVPTLVEEVRQALYTDKEKAENHLAILEKSDAQDLQKKKAAMEKQLNTVKSDLATTFGRLATILEEEKCDGVKEIGQISKEFLEVKERSGEKTVSSSYRVSDSKWYRPSTWGKSHREYTYYTEHYSYCLAADAVSNMQKYALESQALVSEVFSNALNLKELKRNLLDVVTKNFDLADENYDPGLFRALMEKALQKVEIPVFSIDVSDSIEGIAVKFTGELTSAGQKNDLSIALSKAIAGIFKEISEKLQLTVAEFKKLLFEIASGIENELLTGIEAEFRLLQDEIAHKEEEIQRYSGYIAQLGIELNRLKNEGISV